MAGAGLFRLKSWTKAPLALVTPSLVGVPTRSRLFSVTVVLVVQPSIVSVDFVVVLKQGPFGVSLADTVTVRVGVQTPCLVQASSATGVEARATDMSLPTVISRQGHTQARRT